jgi:hypothetical protein
MHIRNTSDLAAYDALPNSRRRKAYDELIACDDRKRMGELRAFLGFVGVCRLPVEHATVTCSDPPYPDIRCTLDGPLHFFELGEVTDQGLASRYSESLRTGKITGGFYSQDEPLRSILMSKAQKTYLTDGAPVDLVLYYWKQTPYDPEVQKVLWESRALIHQMLSPGPFSGIWIYEHPARVLARFGGHPDATSGPCSK